MPMSKKPHNKGTQDLNHALESVCILFIQIFGFLSAIAVSDNFCILRQSKLSEV